MRGWLALPLLAAAIGCGGGPVGARLPRPDTAVVAGTAAAIAGAATLANPNAAGKKPEAPSPGVERRTVQTESMPGGVLERLDEAEQRGEVPAERQAVLGADAGVGFPMPAAPAVPRTQPRR